MIPADRTTGVDFRHPEYEANVADWQFVNDICDSKNLGKYLVTLNPQDTSQENNIRNAQFKKRAIFYAIAGYTSRGLVGKAFAKKAQLKVPALLEYVDDNIDGCGVSIDQQAQDVVRDVTRIGRCGLHVDFPESDGELSQAQLAAGGIFATVTKYDANQIINWQTRKIGAQVVLSKVVLAMKSKMEGPDGFSFDAVDVRLELGLDDEGIYYIREWRIDPTTKEWVVVSIVVPKDATGKPLPEIPFIFVGSDSNTPRVEIAPMRDICAINAGHYNNSAIYEDSVFVVGQAQPWMSGITKAQLDLMADANMYVGSGRLLGVGSGEQFGFAQAEPNPLAREAMQDKVGMMIGLGAMFLTPGTATKTATQAHGELLAQHSVLSLIVSNVSEAYKKALGFVGQFMGTSEEATYELNQDFISPQADANMIREVIAGFLAGVIPPADFLSWQQRHGLISQDKTLDEFNEERGASDPMPDLD